MTDQTPIDDRMLQLQAGLAKIKQSFLNELPDLIDRYDDLLNRLYEDEEADAAAVIEEIKFHAHKLHGRSGTFGLDRLGQQAAAVERAAMNALEGARPIDTEAVEVQLVTLLDEVEATLEST